MPLSSIQRLSGVLHGLTLACILAAPIIIGLIFVALLNGVVFADLAGKTPQGFFLWAGVAVSLLPGVALLWVLNVLRQLFDNYRVGDVLTRGSAELICLLGKGFFLIACLNIVVQPIKTLLFSWQAPAGERSVSIGISHADIGFVLLAGLLTVIGWAMTEAARQAEENRSFV